MLARLQPPQPAKKLRLVGAGSTRPPMGRLQGLPGIGASVVVAERDEVVVAQGDPADCCFVVEIGCLRTVSLMPDGRRQIGEFLLPGDLFGWEALGEHSFGAEAVTQVALRRHSRRSLEASAERDPAFARRLRALTARKLRAGQEHALILGRMTASERIARFLLDMAARMNGATDAFVDLPMSRADIADYLGLTAETVCRELTQMQRQSIIAIDRAQIVIRDSRVLHIRGGARPGAPRLQVIAAEFLAAVPDGTPSVRGV